MRPKIDVMEREWKNLEFEGDLNKAVVKDVMSLQMAILRCSTPIASTHQPLALALTTFTVSIACNKWSAHLAREFVQNQGRTGNCLYYSTLYLKVINGYDSNFLHVEVDYPRIRFSACRGRVVRTSGLVHVEIVLCGRQV